MNVFKRILAAFIILAAAAALLAFPQEAARGAAGGLQLSAGVVIPTLFPFMAIAGFLALSGAGDIIAWPMLPVTRHLLKLPDEAGGALLMSFVGGYPAGAKTLATLVLDGRLDAQQASRMLCFCVNAGPGFLVSAVGSLMYGSPAAGWILLLAQTVASLTLGVIVSAKKPAAKKMRRRQDVPLAGAFVEAVTSAASAMLYACAFIVFFSVVSELIGVIFQNSTRSSVYILTIGLLEVTKGCAESVRLGGGAGFALAAFFVGFGGVSILCQVAAIMRGTGVSLSQFLLTRPLAGLISAAVALPLYRALHLSAPAMSNNCPPIPSPSGGGVVGAACLLIASAILLLSCRRGTEVTGD